MSVSYRILFFWKGKKYSRGLEGIAPMQTLKATYDTQASIKKLRFPEINLAYVGMVQWMNALADKVQNKTCYAHSDMHSITWPHYSTTISIPT